jgi:hypothetical protein
MYLSPLNVMRYATASPDFPQPLHHHLPPSPCAGQARNLSRPPHPGQGEAHSPPLVEETFFAVIPSCWSKSGMVI